MLPSGGERPAPLCCRSSIDEAGGSLNRETPGRVESSPDNAGTGQHYRMVGSGKHEAGRCTRGTSALTPLKSPASSNSVDMGWSAVRTNTSGVTVLGTLAVG